MIVDHGIGRFQLDGLFQLPHSFRILAEAVIGPAQTVDNIAVGRAQLDRAAQHLEGLGQVQALVDPGIAKIIEHQRLVGKQLQRLAEISLRLRPALRAFEGNAAEIIGRPVAARAIRQQERARVGHGGFRELLARALQVGQREHSLGILRALVDNGLEMFQRLFGLALALQQQADLHI